jgi:hypothetical protein
MKDLIDALNIFAKYTKAEFPTHCEHDVLYVVVNPADVVLPEDLEKLKELGFNPDGDVFKSYRFGSC